MASSPGELDRASRETPGGDRISLRLVSCPSWELFAEQASACQEAVLPPDITARLAVEVGVTMGWHRWVGSKGRALGLDRYGASAPVDTVCERLGFPADHVVQMTMELLG